MVNGTTYTVVLNGKLEAQTFFFHPFTVCSSFKRKFVVCPLVDEETNGSLPYANGITDLPIYGTSMYCIACNAYLFLFLFSPLSVLPGCWWPAVRCFLLLQP